MRGAADMLVAAFDAQSLVVDSVGVASADVNSALATGALMAAVCCLLSTGRRIGFARHSVCRVGCVERRQRIQQRSHTDEHSNSVERARSGSFASAHLVVVSRPIDLALLPKKPRCSPAHLHFVAMGPRLARGQARSRWVFMCKAFLLATRPAPSRPSTSA